MKMPAPAPKAFAKVENDLHPAVIVAAAPVMDPANPAIPLLNDNGKYMVNFRFQLLEEKDDEGNPVVLYRSKMSVSYGQYAGKWADYAQVIEAAIGIPGGDKAQHNVDTDEFVGKQLRVQTANVLATDGSGKTYTNAVGYFAPKKQRDATVTTADARAALIDAQIAARTTATKPTPAESVGLTEADLEDLPF